MYTRAAERPTQPHDLIRTETRAYHCPACGQTWKNRPQTRCPRLPVYPKRDYAPLLTQTQLGYLNYDNRHEALPPPAGLYYSHGVHGYITLYDPAQAAPRKTPPRRRLTICLMELYWPRRTLFLIEALRDFRKARHPQFRDYGRIIHDLALWGAALAVFAPDEITPQMNDALHLPLSPCLTRRHYASYDQNTDEQIILATTVLYAYEKVLSLTETPDMEAQL